MIGNLFFANGGGGGKGAGGFMVNANPSVREMSVDSMTGMAGVNYFQKISDNNNHFGTSGETNKNMQGYQLQVGDLIAILFSKSVNAGEAAKTHIVIVSGTPEGSAATGYTLIPIIECQGYDDGDPKNHPQGAEAYGSSAEKCVEHDFIKEYLEKHGTKPGTNVEQPMVNMYYVLRFK